MTSSPASAGSTINRQWLLACLPESALTESCFTYREVPVGPAPSGGMVLVQHNLLLAAATIRNFISGVQNRFHPTVEVGQPVIAPSVSTVVESRDPDRPVGTRLLGLGTWEDYAWIDPVRGYIKLPGHVDSIDAFGKFGVNARTAYAGLINVGRPAPGEVLLVSGAAGSVGSTVMQLGRIVGCSVVGICGGGEKARWLKEVCGISELINYRNEDVGQRIDELCPKGVDIYFDNVGGDLLKVVSERMRKFGRIVLCGQIAMYDQEISREGPSLDMMRIVYGRLRLEGFIGSDFDDQFETMLNNLVGWDNDGLLHHRVDVRDGFRSIPNGLISVLNGTNLGTVICRLDTDQGPSPHEGEIQEGFVSKKRDKAAKVFL